MFRMLGSGTESVMAAIRVARCATKHKRIIKVGGAYHGWSDQMVYGLKIPGSRQFLESHGIPGSYKTTDEVRPNDLKMLEKMLRRNKLKGGTAAVIVEPVGPESGTRPVDFDYNEKARILAKNTALSSSSTKSLPVSESAFTALRATSSATNTRLTTLLFSLTANLG